MTTLQCLLQVCYFNLTKTQTSSHFPFSLLLLSSGMTASSSHSLSISRAPSFLIPPSRLPYILALFQSYHSFLHSFTKTIMFCLRDCQSVCWWADNLVAWLLSSPLFQLCCLQSFCHSLLCQTLLLFSALPFAHVFSSTLLYFYHLTTLNISFFLKALKTATR